MERGRDRRTVGRNGEGAVHRVGLTRHCLTSGRVQLPFALSDAFPEGDLLAHDVDRDEVLLLESLPPRRLSGLREYFERNELQVNDLLEFRLAAGELRLACVRRARRAEGEARASTSAGGARPAAEAAEGSEARGAAAPDVDQVIGRIGSVTVRRLGSGRFAPPSEAALRTTRPAVRAVREAVEESPSEAPAPAAPDAAPAPAADAGEALAAPVDAAGEGREPPAGAPGRATDAKAKGARRAQARPADASAGAYDSGDDLDALLDVAPTARAEAERDRVREGDLLDEGEVRARDRAGRAGPILRWLRRPAGGDERPRPPSQPQAGRSDALAAPQAEGAAPGAEAAASRPRRTNDPAPSDRAPAPAPGVAAAAATDPAERQRAREEALSRAGDLRSRIVRWLLDPGTPVIVQHEHVRLRFGLDAAVVRDVLGGILDDPPPSLRLTAVREDMLRISRVTVQQEG